MGIELPREVAYRMFSTIRTILKKDSASTHIIRINSEMKRSLPPTSVGGKEHGRRE